MRIGIVGEQWVTARPGGMNRYVAGLHEALGHAGAEVTTFCLAGADDPLPDGVVRTTDPGASARRRMLATRQALLDHGPFDLVDDHFAPYAIRGPGGTPAPVRVTHFHGPWAEESRTEGAGALTVAQRRAIEWCAYRSSDLHICDSDAFADELRDRHRVPPTSIRTISPGLDVEGWSTGDRHLARTALGLDADAFVVVTVRRLVRRMGHGVLLDAWSELASRHPRAVLVVVGEGPLETELRARATGIDGEVRFTGRVDDDTLHRWYVAADLQVVPTLEWEGFGLIVLEAMGCGRPSLVTDVGGLAGVAGRLGRHLVVPPDDVVALTDRLDRLIAGELELPDETACRRLAETFAWDRVATTHLELYADLLAGAAPRATFATPIGVGEDGRR